MGDPKWKDRKLIYPFYIVNFTQFRRRYEEDIDDEEVHFWLFLKISRKLFIISVKFRLQKRGCFEIHDKSFIWFLYFQIDYFNF